MCSHNKELIKWLDPVHDKSPAIIDHPDALQPGIFCVPVVNAA